MSRTAWRGPVIRLGRIQRWIPVAHERAVKSPAHSTRPSCLSTSPATSARLRRRLLGGCFVEHADGAEHLLTLFDFALAGRTCHRLAHRWGRSEVLRVATCELVRGDDPIPTGAQRNRPTEVVGREITATHQHRLATRHYVSIASPIPRPATTTLLRAQHRDYWCRRHALVPRLVFCGQIPLGSGCIRHV